ncbi:hypothetical protein DOTSEDRAFT_46306 [Dothistroma septosporum NZE10]|uniref:Uncharacterized protein n=1 Tax=Dothistroma septosporum (strain NZE10 / CBS 128990) TaxID=675120 RepID=N1PIZ4_DOTSN|nr:hypothetical protein DOTSEDRAFT_46306 [Dothistroma septosporum NZE10]
MDIGRLSLEGIRAAIDAVFVDAHGKTPPVGDVRSSVLFGFELLKAVGAVVDPVGFVMTTKVCYRLSPGPAYRSLLVLSGTRQYAGKPTIAQVGGSLLFVPDGRLSWRRIFIARRTRITLKDESGRAGRCCVVVTPGTCAAEGAVAVIHAGRTLPSAMSSAALVNSPAAPGFDSADSAGSRTQCSIGA